jgi:hypothetical protein
MIDGANTTSSLATGMRRGQPVAFDGRVWAVLLLGASMLLGLTGCSLFGDQVTDCDTDAVPVTCERDQRFEVGGTQVVVNELTLSTESGGGGQDDASVEAQITLEGEASEDLRAQLHVVEPLTEEELVIDPDQVPVAAGEHTVTWDFGDRGYALRIQTDDFPPNIFLVFSDGEREITVTVMSVEYS